MNMKLGQPSIETTIANGNPVYVVIGSWTVDYAQDCLKASLAIPAKQQGQITIRCNDIKQFDATGIWLLFRRIEELKRAGVRVELEGFRQDYLTFLQEVAASLEEPGKDLAQLRQLPKELWDFFRRAFKQAADVLMFVGWCWMLLFDAIIHPLQFRFRAFIKQCEVTAVRAAPIVGLISFLIAIVIAYQGSMQLKRFGADIYTVDLVTISVLREMAVLLTAIMIAGRSGSAFAAEIGAMKLNEETDALVTTGIDPMRLLVLPRIAALTIMMPLLAFFADMTGLAGGGLLTVLTTKTNWLLYISRLSDVLRMNDFWIGVGKAPAFGFIIAVVGCYHGMKVSTSAESVGKETTNAVVDSIFLVILADALFSLLFTALNL
jgi:phospholipid/cholesterol/gamma-HCH transport system permease protein